MPKVTERVVFHLLQTPCCHTLLCWVNPRMPIWLKKLGSHILVKDEDAYLKVEKY